MFYYFVSDRFNGVYVYNVISLKQRSTCRQIKDTNTKNCIANHSAQDEKNNHNQFSYNDWNDLHMIHDIYINSYKKQLHYYLHMY